LASDGWKVERAMGIEPIRAAPPGLEYKQFDATANAKCDLLASGERSVGDLESALNLSQPSESKHLRVLQDAGLVEVTIDAQRRVYRIRPEPLQEVDAWMAPLRRYWSAQVDALERHLDSIVTPTRTKRQSRKQR
jgi:DNA-binding transcriptional ArsR family regulator